MQTVTTDAIISRSKQSSQLQTNSSKKKNSSKTKDKEKSRTVTIEERQGKNPLHREIRERRVKGKGRKHSGGETSSGHAQDDFGRGKVYALCSRGFWKGKCATKREVRGIEGSACGKRSTEMWSETQAKKNQSMAGK